MVHYAMSCNSILCILVLHYRHKQINRINHIMEGGIWICLNYLSFTYSMQIYLKNTCLSISKLRIITGSYLASLAVLYAYRCVYTLHQYFFWQWKISTLSFSQVSIISLFEIEEEMFSYREVFAWIGLASVPLCSIILFSLYYAAFVVMA